ncbi:hypothetical protein JOD54_002130 [Actinokineospora baliensis]|nr:hypothetical protein [Actinokineospora baliensis]
MLVDECVTEILRLVPREVDTSEPNVGRGHDRAVSSETDCQHG